jgi:hypothetical protein
MARLPNCNGGVVTANPYGAGTNFKVATKVAKTVRALVKARTATLNYRIVVNLIN